MRLAALFCLLALAGCSASAISGSTGEVAVVGLSDPLETLVTVHTLSYARPFMLQGTKQDPAFRAFLAKSANSSALDSLGLTEDGVAYQVYIQTNESDWMHWSSARYLIDGEVVTRDAEVIGSDVSCSRYGCAHYETVGILVSRADLDAFRAGGAGAVVRIDSRTTTTNRDVILPSQELADFLDAVDATRAALR